MTASSVIVRGPKAYLVSDAARYADGLIVEIKSKVVQCPKHSIAITTNGALLDNIETNIASWLDACTDQQEALSTLPHLCQKLRAFNDSADEMDDVEGRDTRALGLIVASYSAEDGRAHGYVVGSADNWFGQGYPAFALLEVHDALLPSVDRRHCPDKGFDPVRHGREILKAQRERPLNEFDQGIVGGFGELTTVSRHEVKTRRLCTWPDRVGSSIAAKPLLTEA